MFQISNLQQVRPMISLPLASLHMQLHSSLNRILDHPGVVHAFENFGDKLWKSLHQITGNCDYQHFLASTSGLLHCCNLLPCLDQICCIESSLPASQPPSKHLPCCSQTVFKSYVCSLADNILESALQTFALSCNTTQVTDAKGRTGGVCQV